MKSHGFGSVCWRVSHRPRRPRLTAIAHQVDEIRPKQPETRDRREGLNAALDRIPEPKENYDAVVRRAPAEPAKHSKQTL